MEKGSLFLWVGLGVVGILSIFAMAFAGYTYTQTQQGGSINVRSINLGTRTITESGTTGTVVHSGTYDIIFTYARPGIIGTQTTTATVGTYTYKSYLDSNGIFRTYILELSPMSYTFTAYATVTGVSISYTNFLPIFANIPYATYMCSVYTIKQNNGGADASYTTIASGTSGTSLIFSVLPVPISSINSGYKITIGEPISIVIGSVAV